MQEGLQYNTVTDCHWNVSHMSNCTDNAESNKVPIQKQTAWANSTKPKIVSEKIVELYVQYVSFMYYLLNSFRSL